MAMLGGSGNDVPISVQCGICSDVCKRGVKVPCCSTRACRSCATCHVTRNKICWNTRCGHAIRTVDLVNDEALRDEVEKYQNEIKDVKNITVKAEAEIDGIQSEETEIAKDVEEMLKEAKECSSKNSEPAKVTGGVSLAMMEERNLEFERCMSPVEKASKELKFGAQLELMLHFETDHASCLMCGERMKSEFIVLKHIQLKHKEEYGQLKTVLETANVNTLNMFLHKAIRSEFLYQQKQTFPVAVNY
eukprot:GFUD01014629.1.p1 GENE.GFUD01014629.1~~GFUD01014629.1.p1  ORF type:complete len:247 (+),score=70.68 GFUD01014629.1:95-835(+)